ncbi:recombination protein NinB [Reyranella sp.]|uniref:recombination protein NinB n=1 Tax=Reyranella sp. TaxID=1929291 RepID=UPI004035616A
MGVAVPLPKRTLSQNAIFHALCGDIAKSGKEWAGCQRTAKEWKTLLISAHATATGLEADVVIGLEGEMVEIRESSASMSVERSTSLIEYTIAWAVMNGIKIRDPR